MGRPANGQRPATIRFADGCSSDTDRADLDPTGMTPYADTRGPVRRGNPMQQDLFETKPLDSEPGWPESWCVSQHHDRVEIWGDRSNPGYTSAYRLRMRKTLEALQALAPPGAAVLDLAAAQGNFALAASALGYRVTWNDLREDLVAYVRAKSPQAERLAFVPGNIFELGDRFLAAFDVVLALEIVEHVAHPDEFLAALASLTRPDGHIIISTPNGGYLRNTLPRFSDCPDPSVFESVQFQPDSDGHIFLLHEDEMAELAGKAGLRVVRHELFTNPLTAGHMKTRALHRVLPIGAIERVTQSMPRRLARKLNCASLTILTRAPATSSGII